jgi:hypothetical protein
VESVFLIAEMESALVLKIVLGVLMIVENAHRLAE